MLDILIHVYDTSLLPEFCRITVIYTYLQVENTVDLDHHCFPTQCRQLINFANTLNPDQARQNVGPDLDPNRLTL